MTMQALTGSTRLSFIFFFTSHIPATVIMDGQGSFLPIHYPQRFTDFLNWYANRLNDPLFLAKPTWIWLSAFFTAELCFQLPYFFTAIRMMWSKKNVYPEWFRLMSLIYGAHTATTLIPILAIIINNPNATVIQRLLLSSIYVPYLIFPVWLMYLCATPSQRNQLQQHQLRTMTPFTDITNTVYIAFFVTHIPTTLCIDSQAFFPASWYPSVLQQFVLWYATTFQDALMMPPFDKIWFSAIVGSECLLQIPYFCIAIHFMLLQPRKCGGSISTTTSIGGWPEWFRTASIIYGSHTSTTLIPILVEICYNESAILQWKLITFLIYSTYLIVPAGLVYLAVMDSLAKEIETPPLVKKLK